VDLVLDVESGGTWTGCDLVVGVDEEGVEGEVGGEVGGVLGGETALELLKDIVVDLSVRPKSWSS
jgi:hypothetical protein